MQINTNIEMIWQVRVRSVGMPMNNIPTFFFLEDRKKMFFLVLYFFGILRKDNQRIMGEKVFVNNEMLINFTEPQFIREVIYWFMIMIASDKKPCSF